METDVPAGKTNNDLCETIKQKQRIMAKVEFKKESPIQSLSGSVGKITFRTVNGQTFVHIRSAPRLPKNATWQQKKAFRKRKIVDACVERLQDEMEDMIEAIGMRKKIKNRVGYLYDQFATELTCASKIQKAVMAEYKRRFAGKHELHTTRIRETSEMPPTKKRKKEVI